MALIEITEEDKKWVRSSYPDLVIQEGTPIRLVGVLKFKAVRGSSLPEIQDEYQIEIELSDSQISELPQLRETGGRLEKIAEEKGIDLGDLHLNPNVNPKNRVLCLCSPLEESNLFPNGFSLKEFFSNILIPFFYAQSYFEKNDRWPWEHYSHGYLGLLESYASIEQTDCVLAEKCIRLVKRDQQSWDSCKVYLSKKGNIKGHWLCICDSSLIFRKCHFRALEGLRRLKQDVSDCSIEI